MSRHARRYVSKPRFLEELHAIREEMSRECDYDVDLFAEMVRSGERPELWPGQKIRGFARDAPAPAFGDEQTHSEHTND